MICKVLTSFHYSGISHVKGEIKEFLNTQFAKSHCDLGMLKQMPDSTELTELTELKELTESTELKEVKIDSETKELKEVKTANNKSTKWTKTKE